VWTAGRRVAVMAAVVIATWGLVHAATRGVARIAPLYSPSTLRAERGQSSFFDCLEQRLRAVVPRKAAVFVANTDVASLQRLTELATPWARPVLNRSQARYAIAIRPGGGATSCGGTIVVVTGL
jgi:hypothetical protein